MQNTLESLEGLERKFTIEVPAAAVEEALEQTMRAARPRLKVAGYRPGKVPPNIIKEKFGGELRREALENLIDKSYREALIEHKQAAISAPHIDLVSGINPGDDLKFTAVFEVFPEITVKGLDSFQITLPVTKLTDADVDIMVNTLRRQQAVFIEKNDRAAKENDRVRIDFVGRLDGKEFEGGSGNDVDVVIGEGRMLPDFENGLKGMKIGEEKTYDVKFPADYHSEQLKGKTAQFTVKISRLEEMQLPEINEKFIKAFGITDGSTDSFKKAIKENMARELENASRRIKRERMLDAIYEANRDQPTAKAQINNEIQRLAKGMNLEKQIPDAKQREELAQRFFAEPAKRNVILAMLFGRLFEERKIELDKDRVEARLKAISASYEDPNEVIEHYRKNREARVSLESAVLEEQLIDQLYEKAKVTEENVDFQGLMAINNQIPR